MKKSVAVSLLISLLLLSGCVDTGTTSVTNVTSERTETVSTVCAHSWQEATCQKPATCSLCGATNGNKGAHKYASNKCVVCGTADERYNEVRQVLQDIRCYPDYIVAEVPILYNSIELYKLASNADTVPRFLDVVESVSDICDYLQKMVNECSSYPELKLLVDECIIDVPNLLEETTSGMNSYTIKAKTFGDRALRVVSAYNVFCDNYGLARITG